MAMNILNNGRFGMAAALAGTMKKTIERAVSGNGSLDVASRAVTIQQIGILRIACRMFTIYCCRCGYY